MSAGSAGPFRVVYERSDGQRFYYSREIETRDRYNQPRSQPHFSDDARQARKLMTAQEAVARRDAFRTTWPEATFFIEAINGEGGRLFENRTAEVARTEAPVDNRVPHHTVVGDIDILIVPGSDRYWYVRFPGSGIESLRGATSDEAAQAYAAAVELYPHIAEHVERHVVPEPSEAQLRAQIENAKLEIEQAKFGPGRRRPGDIRR